MDAPNHYRICVERHLGDALIAHFPGFGVALLPDGTTRLDADLPDQAALHGVLARIRDLGLVLISVQRAEEATRETPQPP